MGKSIFKILPPPSLYPAVDVTAHIGTFNGVTVVGFSKVLSFDRKIAVNGKIAGLILQ